MKRKSTLALFISAAIMMSSCGSEKDAVSLKYEKYTLANGLEVVLHHDDSDPVVSVAIQYHVGSSREKPGKTGFAHFFEHMLFQRSENLPRNAFFQNIDAMGGTFNGSTGNDGTNYYETVPRDALEKVLWMESDRMGYFINTVTQGGLEREIDVVSNEKRQGENSPYGLSYDILVKNLFPEGHPYSWTVIGEIPDLRSATVEDVKEFYNKYYTTSNATLVISGDFDDAQAKALVEKYFGEIPARPRPESLAVQAPVIDNVKKIYHEDPFANSPLIQIAYAGVEHYNADGYALDFLGNLLAGDKKSPMYKVLVEERKLVPGIEVYNQQMELAGMIMLGATTFPGVKIDDVYAGIEEAYARFEKNGIDPKDLERYKAIMETSTYNRLTSNLNKAMSMARDNVFGGAPDRTLQELQAYKDVTVEDIMRVYEKYIKGKNFLALSTVPKGSADLALSGSVEAVVNQESIEDQKLSSTGGAIIDDPYEKTPSKIDRSVEPALLANTPALKVPEIWNTKLGNGMEIKGIVYNELPLVNFSIGLNKGMLVDNPSKVGVAYMTAMMLNEGTALKTPEELEEAIGQLGARLYISSYSNGMSVDGNCLKKDFPKLITLVEEMLLKPRWDEKSFEVVKERTLDNIRQAQTQPSFIGNSVFKNMIFGKGNILAANSTGTEESIAEVTLDELKAFYAANISSLQAKMSFVGGLNQKEVEQSLGKIASPWGATEVKPLNIASNDIKPAAAKIYFIDYPDARQSYIVMGNRAMPMASPEAYPATIVNDRLGASSGSILFEVLRLQKGYTYGAYSSFVLRDYINYFTASSSVQATVTKESLALFGDILKNYKENYTAQDLEKSTTSMLRTMNGSFETPGALLAMLNDIIMYNMPMDYVKQRESTLKSITLEQAKATIAKDINFDNMTIVIVGDAKTQLAGVKSLGLGEVLVVDKNGVSLK